MRYDPEHKAETRARIVQSAARAIRLKGSDQVGVADVMRSVGLTHGGFYAHFASKDALIAEAVDAMFADAHLRSGMDVFLADDPADLRAAFRGYLAAYLSPEHRDRPDRGCPLPALSADVARGGGPAQARFAEGLAGLTARIEAILTRLGIADPPTEAVAVVAQMAGAVGLARAIGDGPASDAILHDTLATLSARLGL